MKESLFQDDKALTLQQAADYLGYSKGAVEVWLKLGLIPHRRGRTTVLKKDLDKFMNLSFDDMLILLMKRRKRLPLENQAFSEGFQDGMIMTREVLQRASGVTEL